MTFPPQDPKRSQHTNGGAGHSVGWATASNRSTGSRRLRVAAAAMDRCSAVTAKKDGKGKWILVGLALVAVIAVSISWNSTRAAPGSNGVNGQSLNTANGRFGIRQRLTTQDGEHHYR